MAGPTAPPATKLQEQATCKADLSYSYWAASQSAGSAQPPPPRKLTEEEVQAQEEALQKNSSGGSRWNHAGTFEEKTVTEWAKSRLKVLLGGVESGALRVTDVNSITGDANIWIVRGKRRCGFDFDLSLEWKYRLADGSTEIRGYLKIPNASPDDMDDLHFDVEIMHPRAQYKEQEAVATKEVLAIRSLVQAQLEAFFEELKQK